MDYARQQRDPTRHAIGIAFVVALHALVIYALFFGLARQAVEIIKKPLNATIIEEIKAPPPPPPPPPKRIVETPKAQAPEQPYVPPPDIPVAAPTQAEPVISAPTTTPPPAPVAIAPPAVVAPPAPPPPKPAVRQGVSCSKMDKPAFPREAIRARIEKGKVDAILTIDEKGNVTDVRIVSADPPRVFERVVRDTLIDWKCSADGSKYQASVEINFTLKDE
jgi:protein TonB